MLFGDVIALLAVAAARGCGPAAGARGRRDKAAQRRQGRDGPDRISTIDPDARVMKIGGGYRPAFNVQLATTADAARAIVRSRSPTGAARLDRQSAGRS